MRRSEHTPVPSKVTDPPAPIGAEAQGDRACNAHDDLVDALESAPAPHSEDFIAWVLSPEGQAVVQAAGYFPVKGRKKS